MLTTAKVIHRMGMSRVHRSLFVNFLASSWCRRVDLSRLRGDSAIGSVSIAAPVAAGRARPGRPFRLQRDGGSRAAAAPPRVPGCDAARRPDRSSSAHGSSRRSSSRRSCRGPDCAARCGAPRTIAEWPSGAMSRSSTRSGPWWDRQVTRPAVAAESRRPGRARRARPGQISNDACCA